MSLSLEASGLQECMQSIRRTCSWAYSLLLLDYVFPSTFSSSSSASATTGAVADGTGSR